MRIIKLILCFYLLMITNIAATDCGFLFNQNCMAKILKDIPPDEKFVALTFDDGPSKITTPRILNVLKTNEVIATFFMLGTQADKNKPIIEQVIREGHEIGNHSYSHPIMTHRSKIQILDELQKTQKILENFDKDIHWFRPPYGTSNHQINDDALKMGLNTVLWTVDSRDWEKISPEKLEKRVLKDVKPGSVILFHDTKNRTVEALPDIIQTLKKEGYKFVTMSQWLKLMEDIKRKAIQKQELTKKEEETKSLQEKKALIK